MPVRKPPIARRSTASPTRCSTRACICRHPPSSRRLPRSRTATPSSRCWRRRSPGRCPKRMAVAVIGGGVTGLAAAYRLQTLGFDPTVYEAGQRPGGVVGTERRDGFLAETGPNSLTTPKPSVAALLTELGLGDRLLEASPAGRKRYIVRDGRLTPLPASPIELVTSSVFSFGAKLALLREPFVPPSDPAVEESVADFVRRRLGAEPLDYVAGPFVSGIYAGDPEALSLRHALPRVHALEQEHGSLIAAAVSQARARRRRRSGGSLSRILSFPTGMGELTEALTQRLGNRIRCGTPVLGVARRGSRGLSSRGPPTRSTSLPSIAREGAGWASSLPFRTHRSASLCSAFREGRWLTLWMVSG